METIQAIERDNFIKYYVQGIIAVADFTHTEMVINKQGQSLFLATDPRGVARFGTLIPPSLKHGHLHQTYAFMTTPLFKWLESIADSHYNLGFKSASRTI